MLRSFVRFERYRSLLGPMQTSFKANILIKASIWLWQFVKVHFPTKFSHSDELSSKDSN